MIIAILIIIGLAALAVVLLGTVNKDKIFKYHSTALDDTDIRKGGPVPGNPYNAGGPSGFGDPSVIFPEEMWESDDEKTAVLTGRGLGGVKPHAWLVRRSDKTRTDLEGMVFSVGKSASQVNYRLTGSKMISRRHATFYVEDGQFLVCDEKSANGTWINGTRLSPGVKTPLKNGDVIRFADTEYEFHYDPATISLAAAAAASASVSTGTASGPRPAASAPAANARPAAASAGFAPEDKAAPQPESRTKFYFESNDTKLIYEIEHDYMRKAFFTATRDFISAVSNTAGLVNVWSALFRKGGIPFPYKESDFAADPMRIDESLLMLRLKLPKPEASNLCYRIYYLFDLNYRNLACYTIEKSIDTDFLCGWDGDRHVNYHEIKDATFGNGPHTAMMETVEIQLIIDMYNKEFRPEKAGK